MTTTAPSASKHDGTDLVRHDPWLEPYEPQLRERFAYYQKSRADIDRGGGLDGPISRGYEYFGLNRGTDDGKPGVWYREWAPAATYVSLIGEFNGWDRGACPAGRDEYGVWHLFLPDDPWAKSLVHGSKVKVHISSDLGPFDRLPAYIRRVEQEPDHSFVGVYWNPPQPYRFRNPNGPAQTRGLRIYEAHVGMATEQEKVGSYDEFARDVLPRISKLGYNAIQLMAIMEHPYYGSFGYHVSNFYAASSRFGTPEQLKHLIDVAHGLGVIVLLDVVHSHAVKNVNEGLNKLDGTDHLYFHAGGKGEHSAWDSMLFDYGKYEVQRFLLSNLRFWLAEYHFDGFRFDGVTSMLYVHHGIGKAFARYDDYFGDEVDADAVVYLQLANELVHHVNPRAVTIAEDVSGMVGIGRPVAEGGLGFDYRLAMGVPDYWIKLLKEKPDEQWTLNEIYHTLLNRRFSERHVGYVESHDQALVGDKTLSFQLMDKEMYWHMDRASASPVVDRGVALHKMIRLITFSLAGDAYLTFMGNEFGHGEWVDFPREGNGYSYKHARRQWSLAENPFLRYGGLLAFDAAMQALDQKYNLLGDPFIQQLYVHEDDKLIVYRRGPLVFAFNFNPSKSYSDLRIPVPDPFDYHPALNTDDYAFGGQNRIASGVTYYRQDVGYAGQKQSVQIYLPSRTAQVLAPT